jgi:hypothetical protein
MRKTFVIIIAGAMVATAFPTDSSESTYAVYAFWLILTGYLALLALRFVRARRIKPGHCNQCGYSLTGNTSGVCPECGTPVAGKAEVKV